MDDALTAVNPAPTPGVKAKGDRDPDAIASYERQIRSSLMPTAQRDPTPEPQPKPSEEKTVEDLPPGIGADGGT